MRHSRVGGYVEVALHLEACYGEPNFQVNTLRLLLDQGADVNATDNGLYKDHCEREGRLWRARQHRRIWIHSDAVRNRWA